MTAPAEYCVSPRRFGKNVFYVVKQWSEYENDYVLVSRPWRTEEDAYAYLIFLRDYPPVYRNYRVTVYFEIGTPRHRTEEVGRNIWEAVRIATDQYRNRPGFRDVLASDPSLYGKEMA